MIYIECFYYTHFVYVCFLKCVQATKLYTSYTAVKIIFTLSAETYLGMSETIYIWTKLKRIMDNGRY